MNEEALNEYYNKFNENKRLTRRRGQVEFIISFKYIMEYLKEFKDPKIIDIGAGTGAYSKELVNKGFDVTAIELVKHNLRIIEENKKIKAYQGNALDLSRFPDNSFDFAILFGPLYHLISKEEKLKALSEAKRIVKPNGIIMVAYITNEYAMITHAFKEKKILENKNKINDQFIIIPDKTDLYSFIRTEEIDELNALSNLERIKLITPDGPTNYIRPQLNALSDEEYDIYIRYIESIAERKDILGASAHLVDILRNKKTNY